jgi:hypothetical protein
MKSTTLWRPKLQTSILSFFSFQNNWACCPWPTLSLSLSEQSSWPVRLQGDSLNWDRSPLCRADFLILLDLSTAFAPWNIRSSSPPSLGWASQALHTPGLHPTWLVL